MHIYKCPAVPALLQVYPVTAKMINDIRSRKLYMMRTFVLFCSPGYQKRLFFGETKPTIIPVMAAHEITIAKFAPVLYKQVIRTGTGILSGDRACF